MSSDLPYVQTPVGRERATPVLPVELYEWTDLSGRAPALAPFTLFPVSDDSVVTRLVGHVGATGSLWINLFGGEAGVNSPGSLELRPGDILPVPTRGQVRAIATEADLPFTAAQA